MGNKVPDLDVRGLSCPEPVILTKNRLTQVPAVLTVLTDSIVAADNIKRLAKSIGYSFLRENKGEEYVLILTKEV